MTTQSYDFIDVMVRLMNSQFPTAINNGKPRNILTSRQTEIKPNEINKTVIYNEKESGQTIDLYAEATLQEVQLTFIFKNQARQMLPYLVTLELHVSFQDWFDRPSEVKNISWIIAENYGWKEKSYVVKWDDLEFNSTESKLFLLTKGTVQPIVNYAANQKVLFNFYKLINEDSADFSLVSSDNFKFRVSKQLLMDSSNAYFSTFFNNDNDEKVFKEGREQLMKMADIESDALAVVLVWFATGKLVAVDPKIIVKVVKAADFLVDHPLLKECLVYMANKMTLDNFYALLQYFVKYGTSEDFNKCGAFFKENRAVLMSNQGIIELKHTDVELAFKLMAL